MRDLRIWFDPPLFRWSRVLAVALLGVLATVAWLAYERGMWGVPAVEPGVVLAPAASGAAAPPQAVVRTPSMPLVTAPLRSTPPAGRGEAPAIGAAARDDCSLAVRTAASDATGADPLRDARSRWLAALEASADAPVRAAGLLWTVRAPASAVADDTRQRARDRLARLAVESPDPVVYGFAMLACEGVRGAASPGGACQMLSPDQWVRVDADNAAVWLAVAERAAAGSPAQAEALRRAASAGSLRMHANDLLPLARRVMPPALPEVARTLLSGELVGVQSGVTLPVGGATEYCGRAQVADANRRGECEALATMFVERGGSLAHLIAGRAVAESLGWPAERLAALRRESETLAPLTVVSPGDTGCRAIDRRTQRALDAARYGELGALRREWQAAAVAASGVVVTNRP